VKRAAAALMVWLVSAGAALAHEPAPPPALDFEPPAPGTYTLHRIMAAPDGEVLGLDGRPAPLARFTRERITLLGLVYTTCVDPGGCPLAVQVFDAVERRVSESARLRAAVRLVLLSIDPAHDTPAAMRGYAGRRATARPDGVPWHFLTTRSTRALAPLLDGFGQDVRRAAGQRPGSREISHVLKAFLIDREGFVREIYSSAFLHPRTVLNDIDTLLMER
jgi:cytochrome oxidase Cu insertion factor (SCO1/SenC/PrrC family)